MNNQSNLGKMYTKTRFRNGGRRAGIGIIEDDYSEESGYNQWPFREKIRFPNDDVDPEELNGPVVIIQPARRKEKNG